MVVGLFLGSNLEYAYHYLCQQCNDASLLDWASIYAVMIYCDLQEYELKMASL